MAKKNDELEVAVAEVVDYLRITGGFAPALRTVVERKVTAEAAKKAKVKVTGGELQKAADAFRAVNGLSKAKDTENWLTSNGLSVDAFEDYLETNLYISKFKESLNKKTGKQKYLSSPGVKESVKEMIYQDWMSKALK